MRLDAASLAFATYFAGQFAGPAQALEPSLPIQDDLRQLIANARRSVVTLHALNDDRDIIGQGTGFFLEGTGVVTCLHVVEGAAEVIGTLESGERLTFTEVVGADPGTDLAVLPAPGRSSTPTLSRGASPAEVGMAVVVIGTPLGLDLTVSNGIVSATRKLDEGVLLQITAPISPGSSGSPVLDSDGRVLGIVTAQVPDGQNLNFATAVSSLDSLGVHTPTEFSGLPSTADSTTSISYLLAILKARSLLEEHKPAEAFEILYQLKCPSLRDLPPIAAREVTFQAWNTRNLLNWGEIENGDYQPFSRRTGELRKDLRSTYEALVDSDEATPLEVARHAEVSILPYLDAEKLIRTRDALITKLRAALEEDADCIPAQVQLARLLCTSESFSARPESGRLSEAKKVLRNVTSRPEAPYEAFRLLAHLEVKRYTGEPTPMDAAELMRTQAERDQAQQRAHDCFLEARKRFPWIVGAWLGAAKHADTSSERNREFANACRLFPHSWRLLSGWEESLAEDAQSAATAEWVHEYSIRNGRTPTQEDIDHLERHREIFRNGKSKHLTALDRLLIIGPEWRKAETLLRVCKAHCQYGNRESATTAYRRLLELDLEKAAEAREHIDRL